MLLMLPQTTAELPAAVDALAEEMSSHKKPLDISFKIPLLIFFSILTGIRVAYDEYTYSHYDC